MPADLPDAPLPLPAPAPAPAPNSSSSPLPVPVPASPAASPSALRSSPIPPALRVLIAALFLRGLAAAASLFAHAAAVAPVPDIDDSHARRIARHLSMLYESLASVQPVVDGGLALACAFALARLATAEDSRVARNALRAGALFVAVGAVGTWWWGLQIAARVMDLRRAFPFEGSSRSLPGPSPLVAFGALGLAIGVGAILLRGRAPNGAGRSRGAAIGLVALLLADTVRAVYEALVPLDLHDAGVRTHALTLHVPRIVVPLLVATVLVVASRLRGGARAASDAAPYRAPDFEAIARRAGTPNWTAFSRAVRTYAFAILWRVGTAVAAFAMLWLEARAQGDPAKSVLSLATTAIVALGVWQAVAWRRAVDLPREFPGGNAVAVSLSFTAAALAVELVWALTFVLALNSRRGGPQFGERWAILVSLAFSLHCIAGAAQAVAASAVLARAGDPVRARSIRGSILLLAPIALMVSNVPVFLVVVDPRNSEVASWLWTALIAGAIVVASFTWMMIGVARRLDALAAARSTAA